MTPSPEQVPGLVSTAADLDASGAGASGAMVQWVLRFCQLPETFPVFMEWVRSIWPACPYSDREVFEDLRRMHNLFGLVLGLYGGEGP